jgi:hypothetical protein
MVNIYLIGSLINLGFVSWWSYRNDSMQRMNPGYRGFTVIFISRLWPVIIIMLVSTALGIFLKNKSRYL